MDWQTSQISILRLRCCCVHKGKTSQFTYWYFDLHCVFSLEVRRVPKVIHTNNHTIQKTIQKTVKSGKCSFFLERRWDGSKEQVKLKWCGGRGWEKLRWSQWISVVERDCKEWFEACRYFHILKEIDICVHSDADCTTQLQINNHNHKTPRDWLSIELSFFSLWQIWILLLQGSQTTLLLSVLWVCACTLVCLRIEGIQIFIESVNYGHFMKCVWAILWQCID